MPSQERHVLSALQFLALTALALVAIEFLVRLTPVSQFGFWREVESTAAAHPIDFLFVGSSRVAAAIDADAVRDFFPNSPAIHVINAGSGHTTFAEYFLALRNTLRLHAPNFRNCTLFLECSGELYDAGTWSGPWVISERPDILSPFLRTEDTRRYWGGPHPLEDKLKLTFDWLLQPWATYSRALTVGKQRSELPQKYLAPLLEKILLNRTPSIHTESGLTSAGGIRSDEEGIALARTVIKKGVENQLAMERQSNNPTFALADWAGTIAADIVRLARSNHIQLIFFAPPQHSLMKSLSEPPRRRIDRANFLAMCEQWGTPLLVPDFPVTDEDFPDILHLRRSRAPAFTKALMESWQRLPKH